MNIIKCLNVMLNEFNTLHSIKKHVHKSFPLDNWVNVSEDVGGI